MTDSEHGQAVANAAVVSDDESENKEESVMSGHDSMPKLVERNPDDASHDSDDELLQFSGLEAPMEEELPVAVEEQS